MLNVNCSKGWEIRSHLQSIWFENLRPATKKLYSDYKRSMSAMEELSWLGSKSERYFLQTWKNFIPKKMTTDRVKHLNRICVH